MPSNNLKEGIQYQYWMLVITLLKQGIPYNLIEQVTDEELTILLGVGSAMIQIEQEAMEREQRQTQMKGSMMS